MGRELKKEEVGKESIRACKPLAGLLDGEGDWSCTCSSAERPTDVHRLNIGGQAPSPTLGKHPNKRCALMSLRALFRQVPLMVGAYRQRYAQLQAK